MKENGKKSKTKIVVRKTKKLEFPRILEKNVPI
jgi:hypothetical protein